VSRNYEDKGDLFLAFLLFAPEGLTSGGPINAPPNPYVSDSVPNAVCGSVRCSFESERVGGCTSIRGDTELIDSESKEDEGFFGRIVENKRGSIV